MRSITVLGATGSIGSSTLDLIAQHPETFRLYAATAFSRVDKLAEIVIKFSPRYAVVRDAASKQQLQALLGANTCRILVGEEGLCEVAAASDVDMVMAAIVGAAGLAPCWAAAKAGKLILLANKETLVTAGGLFMSAVEHSGGVLLPIDSEHNAIFQCMPHDYNASLAASGIRKIHLTASGGPFRRASLEQLRAVTPEQAVAHPNWSMGQKISVDSASMMNKGLELIEACWLFSCDSSDIDIVVHPQSVIHSMVEYVDGSVLAQLGNPDMRTPIAHAMAWPQRMPAGVTPLNLMDIARLDFEAPDYVRFPCLRLARQAAEQRGYSSVYMNAANEIAVQAFLERRLSFLGIADLIERVMSQADRGEPGDIIAVKEADAAARRLAEEGL
ncbi:MAG TPA: 1-deoxy-D-xylulose-5-phosphate reductoisomerase [Pseudomonadales bacterium]|nr:1-deoxy-D-xylulose-5-phosphate reductoisomerase [Pseudomonadales bacterium]